MAFTCSGGLDRSWLLGLIFTCYLYHLVFGLDAEMWRDWIECTYWRVRLQNNALMLNQTSPMVRPHGEGPARSIGPYLKPHHRCQRPGQSCMVCSEYVSVRLKISPLFRLDETFIGLWSQNGDSSAYTSPKSIVRHTAAWLNSTHRTPACASIRCCAHTAMVSANSRLTTAT